MFFGPFLYKKIILMKKENIMIPKFLIDRLYNFTNKGMFELSHVELRYLIWLVQRLKKGKDIEINKTDIQKFYKDNSYIKKVYEAFFIKDDTLYYNKVSIIDSIRDTKNFSKETNNSKVKHQYLSIPIDLYYKLCDAGMYTLRLYLFFLYKHDISINGNKSSNKVTMNAYDKSCLREKVMNNSDPRPLIAGLDSLKQIEHDGKPIIHSHDWKEGNKKVNIIFIDYKPYQMDEGLVDYVTDRVANEQIENYRKHKMHQLHA